MMRALADNSHAPEPIEAVSPARAQPQRDANQTLVEAIAKAYRWQ